MNVLAYFWFKYILMRKHLGKASIKLPISAILSL